MDTIDPEDGGDGDGGRQSATGISSRRTDEQLNVVHSQMRKLQNSVDSLRVKLEERGWLDNRRHTQITDTLSRIALQPVVQARALSSLDAT